MTPWTVLALAAGGMAIAAAETLAPLRLQREPRAVRTGRNLTLAALGLAAAGVLQVVLVVRVSIWTQAHEAGLLGGLPSGFFPRGIAAFLLLDYTLWIWHFLNHRVPFFWRFHRVHHVDRDMDASTGLRFHFGELVLSAGYRALQIVVIGAEPASVAVWQTVLLASILFHHSNIRLPVGLERVLVRVLVTPRMHGIHHSDYRAETDSNWSSILSAWDYLHRTVRLDIPQGEVQIGVAAYQDPRDITLAKVLALPFDGKPDDWARTDGGPRERPSRADPWRLRA